MTRASYTRKIASYAVIPFIVLAALVIPNLAVAGTQVTLSGPQQVGPLTPGPDGRFAFPNLPLKRNSVNVFTVTAKDDFGNTLTRNVSITQLSLDSIVVSKITTKPLSIQEVQQLVNDGVIKLDNPENFNVSTFDIVLTIGGQALPISVPIAMGMIPETAVSEEIAPQSDPGDGGANPNVPDVQIIVFQQPLPALPGQPPPPPMPGVIIIEGRIKTLKEFYSIRLLLMNASGIFTLSNVKAEMSFPNGGLSNTLPADGIVSFGDILPGTSDQPGQAEREFIIRGDEIGVRPVRVAFGGTLTGPGIPEDTPLPFNGAAESTVEVKGPPSFLVQVTHPPSVIQDVPYELTVNITNAGDTPALYASIDLDVGAAAKLVDCELNDATQAPVCTDLIGPAIRSLGNILPGQSVKESFTIIPLMSGPITSCMAASDQNINLQVFVGNLGCLVGKFPPSVGVADGIPTVSVLPTPNLIGVGIDSPVVAFFSEQMNIATVTTGPTGTFRVLDKSAVDVPGQLRIENLNGNTVAIWQVNDGITNRLNGNSLYSVILSQGITDLQGNGLANVWNSQFSTTSAINDITPPALTLSIEPPVNPNNVLSGQIVRVNAYASDQGTGIARVELRRAQVNGQPLVFELIDQKTIFETSSGPCIFSIDSAKLVAGSTYQFKATAYDKAGNAQDSTIPVILAASVVPPVVRLPDSPAIAVLQGISIDLTPLEVSNTVRSVDFFLDGALQPFSTVTLPPFQASLSTLALLSGGTHTVRAVATDGLNQTGEDTLDFILTANLNGPTVSIAGVTNGAQVTVGTLLPLSGSVQDPVGISSVQFFLDTLGGTPIVTGTQPFTLNTSSLAPGLHRVTIVALNNLGVSNNTNDAASFVDFTIVPVVNGQPPPPPVLNALAPPVGGNVNISGTSVSGGRIDLANVTQGLTVSTFTNGAGFFVLLMEANAGDLLRAVAFDFTQSQQPSAPSEAVVPAPPVLDHIEVVPATINFIASNQFQDLTVTGFYVGGATANLTSTALFTSNNQGTASVNTAGRVVAVASGNAAITVNVEGKQAQVAVNVSIRTLVSVSLTPSAFTLAGISKFQQLNLVGNYSDNTTSLITSGVIFSSNQTAVAVVNQFGLVTSIGFGTATISATVVGLPSAQSAVTVEGIVVTGISVSPNTILFTSAGETRQLQVSRNLSDGTTEPAPPPITFETSDGTVATVTTGGSVRAIANGNATITTRHAGFSALVAVTVNIPIIVLPPPVIASIDRPLAGEGDPFVIRGQNYASVPNENIVRINGIIAEVQSARQDELVATVPPGATSGPVTVEVAMQFSNAIPLNIYPRRAQSFTLSGAVDISAAAGLSLAFTLPPFEVRAGDRVFLSSAPDILAPLSFQGDLRGSIDGSAYFDIPLLSSATELTAAFAPGFHTLDLDLFESGGRISTAPIYLIVGPNGTGPIAGQRSVIGLAQSQATTVTFIDLRDFSGNLLPDGSLVAVTAQQMGLVTRDSCCFINSAGGTLVNGTANDDARFKTFTVVGGRIDVQYDPASAAGLGVGALAVANVQVVPANASGTPIGSRTIAHQAVSLTSFDTAATPRTQSAVIADGSSKIVTIKLLGIRDNLGNIIPDGAKVLVTAQQMSLVTRDSCCFISSIGGTIVNGTANADARFKTFTVTGGQVEIQYDPGDVQLPVGVVRTANIQVLPAGPDGTAIGSRVFSVIPVTLSSPSVVAANITIIPLAALADGADNRVLITIKSIVDNAGNPVPDGTRVAATAQQMSLVTPDNCCFITSAGGTIVNGENNADPRFKTFTISGGEIQIVYSVVPVALISKQAGTARIQMLPSTPAGVPIGSRTFAVADVNLTGYDGATTSANPPSAIADGFSKIVDVRLTGIRDTAGNFVPDGSKVAVTAQQMNLLTPDGCCFIASAGGTIVNGAANSDARFKTFTVAGGQVDIQYDPGSVQLAVGVVSTANVQVLPAHPDGTAIGTKTFAVVPIMLSSESTAAAVSVVPTGVLANGHDNRTVITVTNIVDALGNFVPNGTKIVATTAQMNNLSPDNCCFISSAGGTIVNGDANADTRLKTFTVNDGQVQIIYSADPVALNALATSTANVQLLPATPAGNRIGNRTFALATVSLTGFQSAEIAGAGAIDRNGSATYSVTNILDTAGNPVPDGTTVIATVAQMNNFTPDNCCFISSVSGSITNGLNNSDSRFKTFTVQGGIIAINYTAPNSIGAAVIQLMPATIDGTRIGGRTFAIKTVNIQ